MDAYEAYSYQYNIKIIGMPPIAKQENADQTANLSILNVRIVSNISAY